jgi:AP-3 complex subunit beta
MNTLSLISDAKYFDINNTKFAEIRKFLDSSDVSEKLEAMKRLMAMITLGRDVSMFMPDVVKNVIVKNTEVKKLVYMFLVEHAESQPELALLSINTFQKDLQSPSQRTRGNAMKAMSSIRVPVVVPLVILALKAAVKDTSPYVRRAAATAIPKLFDLDPEEKPVLVECIEELLTSTSDRVKCMNGRFRKRFFNRLILL